MNKTVTINISGIIFHIEEDAYDSLSKYLAAIKGYFSKTDGGNEIMSDIEARIAELLQEKINVSKQVILMTDVDYVKNVMGRPEDFGAEPAREDDPAANTQFEYKQEKIGRRLFRNPDEKTIGGVCSGLAAYFDIDTVWVRLAMVLLVFFGGLSLWVYIIMWLVIPEAKTTADKFAMRGESANINNIFQSFKEEAEDVKSRFQKTGKEYSQQFYDAGTKVRGGAEAVLYTLFNILGRLIGLFLIFMGGILLFGYVLVLLGISIVDGNVDTSISDWKSAILNSPSDYVLGVIAFIIVVGIPIFMMLYAGVRMLFKIRYSNRWLNLSMGLVWLVGFIMACYVTGFTLKQFSESSKLKQIDGLSGIGDTIIIKADPVALRLKALNLYNSSDLETRLENRHGGFHFGESQKGRCFISFASLDVVENNADSMELVIYQSAKGSTKKEANDNARAINYAYHRNGRELIFDQIFYVNPGAKFRDQDLEIKLRIPKGKVVYFDKSIDYLLDDADNVTNTWTSDMLGRRWKMTEKGLECIDCKDLDMHTLKDGDDEDELKTKDISIDKHGIKVNGEDAEIKIDENGIRIKTPEKEYEIKNDKKEKENKTEHTEPKKEAK